jgi:hypothetical protein
MAYYRASLIIQFQNQFQNSGIVLPINTEIIVQLCNTAFGEYYKLVCYKKGNDWFALTGVIKFGNFNVLAENSPIDFPIRQSTRDNADDDFTQKRREHERKEGGRHGSGKSVRKYTGEGESAGEGATLRF